MKVGHSFGRCVRDIVLGRVNIDDVLVIISRTLIHTEEQMENVIKSYLREPDYLGGLDEEKCKEVGRDIFLRGLLHQPRRESKIPGASYNASKALKVWSDAVPTDYHNNPAVASAWEQYQIALKMSSDALSRG